MENRYQELFNHLANEHDLILLESEMQEIIRICNNITINECEIEKPLDEANII